MGEGESVGEGVCDGVLEGAGGVAVIIGVGVGTVGAAALPTLKYVVPDDEKYEFEPANSAVTL